MKMPLSDFAQRTTAVRADLVQSLKLDIIGPSNDHGFAREIIAEEPDVRYLTGYLIPEGAPIEERKDPDADDDDDADEDASGDNGTTERLGGRHSFLPSSIGLSVLIPPEVTELAAEIRWGDYVRLGEEDPADKSFNMELEAWANEVGLEPIPAYLREVAGYARIPREESLRLSIPSPQEGIKKDMVGRGRGLSIEVFCRAAEGIGLPPGTRSVSIFLVNRRSPRTTREKRYPGIAFQVELELSCVQGFTARPDLKALAGGDKEWDEKVNDLQYREVLEYVVGHNVSSSAEVKEGRCLTVWSAWFPEAEVEKVVPSPLDGVELSMETLSSLGSIESIDAAFSALPETYAAWIQEQQEVQNLPPAMRLTCDELVGKARYALTRINKGIALLKADPFSLEAFCLANKAMARSARQRMSINERKPASEVRAPHWYPFQLAFILLNLPGIADPEHEAVERETVDLLFFPTGGGKTEAYLGLAAFTMVLRRLKNPDAQIQGTKVPLGAGLSVLMRYTLRLLTLDQLGRGAALICALELERKQNQRLGFWPFEIGLWVGSGATPNRLGKRGDRESDREFTAYSRWLKFQKGRSESPIPIQSCPWCNTPFDKDNFRFIPNVDGPNDLVVKCNNLDCELNGWDHLPIVTVDEPLYRRLPAFIIATVDKFAALPWMGQVGMLFGKVNSFDPIKGFYGHSESGAGGVRIEGGLLPPDLIIQDELHLISGPLGTIAGLYETAIEKLCMQVKDGVAIRPKIIASTATVRRADRQITALFGRKLSEVFPPPGPDRKNSFFALTQEARNVPARLYLGVSAPGRSVKVATLRILLALLSRSQALFQADGGKRTQKNPVDPYMTVLAYFNSLRELGGTRRIIEDEVILRASAYSNHRRLYPEDSLFANRSLEAADIRELTSRVSTTEVAETKRRLERRYGEKESLDVALATNMISVGLDIIRLGLMLVNGQPKSAAEYIQSTSRVGRDPERPGLVITLFNPFKARDRSHYERFGNWHASFYRAVEATSVTPFSPRALDRALAPALVGLVRHGQGSMAPSAAAASIRGLRASLEEFVDVFAERAQAAFDPQLPPDELTCLVTTVRSRANHLLDDWERLANHDAGNNNTLYYNKKDGRGNQATGLLAESLAESFDDPQDIRAKFKANRSMRDVEAPVAINSEKRRRP
jgi:hypothetical protein